jgi:hypothetical protein
MGCSQVNVHAGFGQDRGGSTFGRGLRRIKSQMTTTPLAVECDFARPDPVPRPQGS